MIYKIIKRLFDIVFSFTILIFLIPVFFVIGIMIKFSSRGPLIYSWKVVGKNGKYFKSYKFRTMIEDADLIKKNLISKNEMKGPFFKITNDPRITKIGVFLRKYSLDELPQFFSVLEGKMSIVGPRPPLQTEYELFSEFEKKKLSIKPGLTCLWQVEGRNEISEPDSWIKKDLEYIENQSFLLDCKIIFQTILVVFKGTGK